MTEFQIGDVIIDVRFPDDYEFVCDINIDDRKYITKDNGVRSYTYFDDAMLITSSMRLRRVNEV